MPVVKGVPMLSRSQIVELGAAAVTELYSEPGDDLAIELGLPPSEFYGRPLLEVMLVRQARNAARTGDRDEVEAILDRRLGKPKTTAENHNISETYEEALHRIAEAERSRVLGQALPVPSVPLVPSANPVPSAEAPREVSGDVW